MRIVKLLGLTLASCVALMLSDVSPAQACGGCFHGPMSTPSVVTGHRMALAVSPTRTVLWDQIQYAGDPADFAWVLPVGPGAVIEQAEPAWFEALEAVTGTRVTSPLVTCSNGQSFQVTQGGSGCGAVFAGGGDTPERDTSTTTMQQGDDGNVTVEHEGTVGPYETATLKASDPMALRTWLTAHNYNIPTDIGPIIDSYVQQGSDFIALRLLPTAGVRQMTPVRVITPGAAPTLPLRMVAAGTGADVSIVLYVIGEGQYATQNFPATTIDYTSLSWTWSSSSSNYDVLRQTALSSNGFLTSFAQQGGLRGQVLQTTGAAATYFASTGQSYTNLTDLYFGEAAGDMGVADACTAVGTAIDAIPQGSEVVENTGTLPPNTVDAKALTCNGFGDLAAALVGMHPTDVWVTRLEADLTRSALDQELTLSPAAAQVPVPNWHLATTSIGSPCPPPTAQPSAPQSSGGCSMRRPTFGSRASLGFVAFGLLLLLRRGAKRHLRER
jgi:hypothetical protein